jgi:phage recombination protein Bet
MSEPKEQQLAKPAGDRLIVVSPGRPPYPVRAQSAFGISPGDWRALVDAIYPSAKTTEAIELALTYCRARKLDPFKRQCHIVPIWDSKQGREVETVWPGIAELRTTAVRTGQHAGFDEALFGPDETRTFKGEVGKREVEKTVTFPAWCRITAYRLVDGQRVPFPGPKVWYLETYATMGKSDVPNEMWETRPRGQLEKCAEAAALRRAFPEEVGSDYIPEEVGRRGGSIDISPAGPEPLGARTEALAERLKAELATAQPGSSGQTEPIAAPSQAQDRDSLVEVARETLKAHGLAGEAREGALQAAFGESSWLKVCKLPADQLAIGLAALTKNLEGLAAMRAALPQDPVRGREPGEDDDAP